MKKRPRIVVVVSDTHCGCQLGLVPASGVELDAGGKYKPNRLQEATSDWWQEFWRKFVPEATDSEPYSVVMNGDAIDGVHHGSTTQWSHNIADQVRCAKTLLKPEVGAAHGRYYHIRGTEAHVGKSGQDEEFLAEQLGAAPDEDGRHSRWDLWLRLGPYLCHFTHHIGTVHSPMSEATAVHGELVHALVEAGRWGDEPPDLICRSHRHRHYEVRFATKKGNAVGIVTPAWQGKTPFTHRLAGARMTQPQFGGVVIVAGKNGLYTKHFIRRIERTREVL